MVVTVAGGCDNADWYGMKRNDADRAWVQIYFDTTFEKVGQRWPRANDHLTIRWRHWR